MTDSSEKRQLASNERVRTALRQLIHRAGEELGAFHSVVTLAEAILEMVPAHETGEPRDAIEAHVRQIQQLCDYSNLDPTQWLNDYTAQGEAAPAQKAVVKRCPKCNRDVTEGCNYCACPYPQATPSSEGSVGG